MIDFITFDVIPYIDDINERFFTTRYSEGEIDKNAVGFGLLGFETFNYTKNTGSLWIFMSWMIGSGFLSMIFRRFAENYFYVKFYKKWRMNENLHANLIVFVMQGYPDLLVSTLVSLKMTSRLDIILTSFNDSVAFFMSGFFGFYVFTLPLFLQSKLNRKFVFLDV